MTSDFANPVVCGDTPLYHFAALLALVPADQHQQVLRDLRALATTKVPLAVALEAE